MFAPLSPYVQLVGTISFCFLLFVGYYFFFVDLLDAIHMQSTLQMHLIEANSEKINVHPNGLFAKEFLLSQITITIIGGYMWSNYGFACVIVGLLLLFGLLASMALVTLQHGLPNWQVSYD